MITILNILQIFISVLLILTILLQVRGGGLGGIFGQPESVYRTRRGIERLLFRATIFLVIIFVLISILSVRLR